MDITLYVFLPVVVCLLCDHGLDFDISLCDKSTNQSRMVIENVCSCGNLISRQLFYTIVYIVYNVHIVWVGVTKLLRARG